MYMLPHVNMLQTNTAVRSPNAGTYVRMHVHATVNVIILSLVQLCTCKAGYIDTGGLLRKHLYTGSRADNVPCCRYPSDYSVA